MRIAWMCEDTEENVAYPGVPDFPKWTASGALAAYFLTTKPDLDILHFRLGDIEEDGRVRSFTNIRDGSTVEDVVLQDHCDLLLFRGFGSADDKIRLQGKIIGLAHPDSLGGIPRINPHHTISRFFDKEYVRVLLEQGLPMPPTVIAESGAEALAAVHSIGGDVIAKPLLGRGGRGVRRVNRATKDLEAYCAGMSETHIVQGFVPEIVTGERCMFLFDGEYRDYAVVKVPGEGHYLTNRGYGGSRGRYGAGASLQERELLRSVADTFDVTNAFVRVDIIGRRDNPYIMEITGSTPGTSDVEMEATAELAGYFTELIHKVGCRQF